MRSRIPSIKALFDRPQSVWICIVAFHSKRLVTSAELSSAIPAISSGLVTCIYDEHHDA